MIVETAVQVIRVLVGVEIRFFLHFRHSKHMQSNKNLFSFLALAAEQRIKSPLVLSFDCSCPPSLCRGWVHVSPKVIVTVLGCSLGASVLILGVPKTPNCDKHKAFNHTRG